MRIKRGDIFYVSGGYSTGSEQRPGRPAVVVSNDQNNEHSTTLEMVYLTTKPKRNLPTHVLLKSLSQDSTAICEQITTVSVERIGEYCGHVSTEEMHNLEDAMLTSLGIVRKDGDAQLAEAETRCAVLQQMYDALLSRVVR